MRNIFIVYRRLVKAGDDGMKYIFIILGLILIFIGGCAGGQISLYNDLLDEGSLEGSNNPLNFQVNYVGDGAELKVILKSDNALILAGQLEYSESQFDVSFQSLSEWLCKYNTDNHRVACASTTPVAVGDVFKFTITPKEGVAPGKYPLNFNVLDFNGQESSAELNTFLNVN